MPVIDTRHSIIRVKGIDDRVKVVDGRLKALDDKVTQYVVHQSSNEPRYIRHQKAVISEMAVIRLLLEHDADVRCTGRRFNPAALGLVLRDAEVVRRG